MASILDSGAAWIAGQAALHLSRDVTYRRGGAAVDVSAVPGQTDHEAIDETGATILVTTSDWIFRTAELVLGGEQIAPEPGDQVEETDAGGTIRTFTVLARPGLKCFRLDRSRTQVRVFTSLTEQR